MTTSGELSFKFGCSTETCSNTTRPFVDSIFSLNMPSFPMLSSQNSIPTTEQKQNKTEMPDLSEILFIKKTVSAILPDVPDILRSVGLGRVCYKPPKCYGKKSSLPHITRNDITLPEINFNAHCNCGQLDWEK